MVNKILLGIVATLTDSLLAQIEPAAGLLDEVHADTKIQKLTEAGNTLAVHNVEHGLPERRCNLVLDDLCTGAVTNDFGTVFDGLHAANVDTDRCVEFQCITAGGSFGIAVHDTNLHTKLVDENDHTVGLSNGTGQFPQGLRHETSLQTDKSVTHFTFNFCLGRQCGNRVHNHNIHSTGTYQCIRDFQCLLAGIRLRNQHGVNIHTDSGSIIRVKSVFSVHKGYFAATLLCLSHNVQSKRRLTGRFRAIDFDNTALGDTTDTECGIQCQRAGGNCVHGKFRTVTEPHNGTLAKIPFNLLDSSFQSTSLFADSRINFLLIHIPYSFPFLRAMTARMIFEVSLQNVRSSKLFSFKISPTAVSCPIPNSKQRQPSSFRHGRKFLQI